MTTKQIKTSSLKTVKPTSNTNFLACNSTSNNRIAFSKIYEAIRTSLNYQYSIDENAKILKSVYNIHDLLKTDESNNIKSLFSISALIESTEKKLLLTYLLLSSDEDDSNISKQIEIISNDISAISCTICKSTSALADISNIATEDNYGLLLLGYQLQDQNYPVSIDNDGRLFVEVPSRENQRKYISCVNILSSTYLSDLNWTSSIQSIVNELNEVSFDTDSIKENINVINTKLALTNYNVFGSDIKNMPSAYFEVNTNTPSYLSNVLLWSDQNYSAVDGYEEETQIIQGTTYFLALNGTKTNAYVEGKILKAGNILRVNETKSINQLDGNCFSELEQSEGISSVTSALVISCDAMNSTIVQLSNMLTSTASASLTKLANDKLNLMSTEMTADYSDKIIPIWQYYNTANSDFTTVGYGQWSKNTTYSVVSCYMYKRIA